MRIININLNANCYTKISFCNSYEFGTDKFDDQYIKEYRKKHKDSYGLFEKIKGVNTKDAKEELRLLYRNTVLNNAIYTKRMLIDISNEKQKIADYNFEKKIHETIIDNMLINLNSEKPTLHAICISGHYVR